MISFKGYVMFINCLIFIFALGLEKEKIKEQYDCVYSFQREIKNHVILILKRCH